MRFGGRPYDWALEFDNIFAHSLEIGDHQLITDRKALGPLLQMAHPSVDHYLPALTIAGAADDKDQLTFMNDTIDIASVSMRSFIYH
jgi:4,5-DOPA dioxygenase extradiol